MENDHSTSSGLSPLQQERLLRLKAEWELAAAKTELARARLQLGVEAVTRDLSLPPGSGIAFEDGIAKITRGKS